MKHLGGAVTSVSYAWKPAIVLFFCVAETVQAFRSVSFPGAWHSKARDARFGLRTAVCSLARRDLLIGAGCVGASSVIMAPTLPAQAAGGSSASLAETLGVLGYGGFPPGDPMDSVLTVFKRQLDRNYAPEPNIPPVKIPRTFCESY